jgi:recombinational DNA repair ATPase RecF
VHLRAVKLRGFKSFPDPVEIRLEPGVGVIVGPNGSGKSNVSDAIRWAAGSLSPTELQEQLARASRSVQYATLKVEGPPHDRSFTAAAVVDGEVLGTGVGRSKKDAEQQAAKEVLLLLDVPAPS